nr:PREDICTED: uncharacterized protein LOC108952562 [Musa acuminata subsp. malaccensis]
MCSSTLFYLKRLGREALKVVFNFLFGRNGGSPDNLDAKAPDSVAGCHLVVHLLHGTVQCSIPVLFVHVVVTCSALVPQPDAIILDLCWFPLKYLPKFSSRFSLYIKEKILCPMKNCFGSVDCLGSNIKLPELGFSSGFIRSPQLHTVNLGVLHRRRWKSSTHHLILMKLPPSAVINEDQMQQSKAKYAKS